VFAGKECARALALMSTSADDCNGNTDDLPEDKKQILRDWEVKFMGKYRVAGALASSGIDLSQYEEQMKVLSDDDAPQPTRSIYVDAFLAWNLITSTSLTRAGHGAGHRKYV